VLKHASGTVRPLQRDHHSYALIELSSPQAGAELDVTLESILGAAIEAGVAEDATIGASEAQNAALWRLREQLSEVQKFEGGSIKHDVSVPVSRVADFIEAASAACEAAMPDIRVCAFGHVGDGNIHFNLSQPIRMDKAAFLAEWERFNRIVHDIVAEMGGSIAAEHGIGLIKRDELLLYKDPVAVDLMRTIKHALDPRNILNPGKVVAVGGDLPPALPHANKNPLPI
jgi:FAD/FMN-containing dehydrogenase